MSSGQSSDEIIKHEIVTTVGTSYNNIRLRIFPQSSNFDQVPFSEGGLTFGVNNVLYGSCDAVWYIENKNFTDPYNNRSINIFPVIALEGTDALTRGSTGNAQYQRFHHALGAVKCGMIGIYYLKEGLAKIQTDLYRMAYIASKSEKGTYLVIQDLNIVNVLIEIIDEHGFESDRLKSYLNNLLEEMNLKWKIDFQKKYNNDWLKFSINRSTIIYEKYVIKYAGRMLRNFTDSSQRAGHIAVGEMFLTKYLFENIKVFYLFPKMFQADIDFLDSSKHLDKEWYLLRHEPNVRIITIDNLKNIPTDIYDKLYSIKDIPLKGMTLKIYNECVALIREMIEDGTVELSI